MFGLDYLSFENIKKMKKDQFRTLVKMKCKKVAFSSLINEKESKSKLDSIEYKSLTIQNYFMSADISLRKKRLLGRPKQCTH